MTRLPASKKDVLVRVADTGEAVLTGVKLDVTKMTVAVAVGKSVSFIAGMWLATTVTSVAVDILVLVPFAVQVVVAMHEAVLVGVSLLAGAIVGTGVKVAVLVGMHVLVGRVVGV
jgi:hypothetical protein